ncbi:MAG: 50S ribosomal protein L18, partial [Candidatus Bathyarchaeota archaeon]
FRRRKEGKTDFYQRKGLIKSRKLRLVVRCTLSHSIAQLVESRAEGDRTLVFASSKELSRDYGWKAPCGNLPAAYLTGMITGYKALQNNLKEAILDIGLKKPPVGSKIFAALKGVVDSGVSIPHGEKIFPSESRVRGEHIMNFAKSYLENENKQNFFSVYLKNNLMPADLPEHFEEVKKSIEKKFVK